MFLSVRGDNCSRMGKTKAKIEEERCDTRGGGVERRGEVYGGLEEGCQSMGRIDVCFMLSNNVRPVVGVREGVVRSRGFGRLGVAFGGELVGVDVKEFEVQMEKRVPIRWRRRCTGAIEAEEEGIGVREKGVGEAALWRGEWR